MCVFLVFSGHFSADSIEGLDADLQHSWTQLRYRPKDGLGNLVTYWRLKNTEVIYLFYVLPEVCQVPGLDCFCLLRQTCE